MKDKQIKEMKNNARIYIGATVEKLRMDGCELWEIDGIVENILNYITVSEDSIVLTKAEKEKLLHEMYEQGRFDAIADLEKEGKVVLPKEEYEKLKNRLEYAEKYWELTVNRNQELHDEIKRLDQERLDLQVDNNMLYLQLDNKGKEVIEKFVDLLTDNGERQTLPIENEKGKVVDKAYIIPQSHLNQVIKQLGVEIKE